MVIVEKDKDSSVIMPENSWEHFWEGVIVITAQKEAAGLIKLKRIYGNCSLMMES